MSQKHALLRKEVSSLADSLIEVSNEHTPINFPSRDSFDTDVNDLVTTVAASEIAVTTEVGQLTSPLFSQKREASADPFGVSGSQQAATSGSQQQQASSSVVNPWQDTDLRSIGILCEVLSHFQVLKGHCRKVNEIENSSVCNFLNWKRRTAV